MSPNSFQNMFKLITHPRGKCLFTRLGVTWISKRTNWTRLLPFRSHTTAGPYPCRKLSFASSHRSRKKNPDDEDAEVEIFDRDFIDMQPEHFFESLQIPPEDTERRERIATILYEYESVKYSTMRVPTEIRPQEMEHILENIRGTIVLHKYLNYLFKKEYHTLNDLRAKKEAQRKIAIAREAKQKEYAELGIHSKSLFDRHGRPVYGLWMNSMFMRVPQRNIENASSWSHLRETAMFGQPLILDFSFEEMMKTQFAINTAMQVGATYGANRYHSGGPEGQFDLWMCNLSDKGPMRGHLSRSLPNIFRYDHTAHNHFITITSRSYLDFFPRERLIYLSPHAPQEMENFDPEAVYIIGALNDKSASRPLTYPRAVSEGIRSLKFPLERHVLWNSGSKLLCLNHVLGVLSHLKRGHSWHEALIASLPSRKLRGKKEIEEINSDRERRQVQKAADSVSIPASDPQSIMHVQKFLVED